MTHFRLLTTGALILSALTAVTAEAQTMVPFTTPQLPFTLSYPQGWSGAGITQGPVQGLVMMSDKTQPATLVQLLFVPANGKTVKLPDEFGRFEMGVKSTGATVQQQSSAAATYGGLAGLEREYTVTKNAVPSKLRVWIAQDAKNKYSFQMTDAPQRYAASSGLFSKIMTTVKFK